MGISQLLDSLWCDVTVVLAVEFMGNGMFVKHINTLVNHEMMTQNVNALVYTLTPDSLTSVTCAQCHSSLHFREHTVPMANVNQAASF